MTPRNISSERPDIFFLTYDEPLKDSYWQELKELIPWAQRVDGVKGFDAAHKACAQAARSSRFYIIDGDNKVSPEFLTLSPKIPFFRSDSVLSWAAKNSINGLIYGNGGIKNWSRSTVFKMKSHEVSENPEMAVDFCFGITYLQRPESLSIAEVGQTPKQAFRSGFREGVKMALRDGQRIDFSADKAAEKLIPRSNLERLKIWCSIGADVSNGLWAIYGARLGLSYLLDPHWNYSIIHDYDWFHGLWEDNVAPRFSGQQESCQISSYKWSRSKLVEECENLGLTFKGEIGLEMPLFSPQQSRFFKSVYINRPRIPVLKEWN